MTAVLVRPRHRAGPVEVESVSGDDRPRGEFEIVRVQFETIRVQRCLRCDAILWTDGAHGSGVPHAPGKRVKTLDDCLGVIE